MTKIFIVGNSKSPLVRKRGMIGKQAGYQIAWFAAEPSNLDHVESYSLPRLLRGAMGRLVAEPFFLSRALARSSPDIVHVHYAFKGLAALIIKKQHPLVVSVMGSDILSEGAYRFPYSPFTKSLLDAADILTSKSEFMDHALLAIGSYKHKIRRINWGVDLNMFSKKHKNNKRGELKIPENDLIFIDPRNGAPFYNKHVILEAFSAFLKDTGRSATLLVLTQAAKPRYLKQLKLLASQLGIESRVRFMGVMDQFGMAELYSIADLTISIPDSDGLPQSVYEAMACGSFLIMRNLPQYEGVVEDGITAKLIQSVDADELAAAMIWAIENETIRDRAAKLTRDYVETFADEKKQSAELLTLYKELLP